jgi:hypothetical protein
VHDLTGDGGWAPYVPAPPSPVPPSDVVVQALDPLRGDLLGWAGNGSTLWNLHLATDTWSSRAVSGGPPAEFSRRAAIVDSLRDRLIVFGVGIDPTFQVEITTVWTLPLDATVPNWSEIRPAGPTPRLGTNGSFNMVVVADRRRDRVLLFGEGNQVWQLDLVGAATWSLLENFPTFFYAPTAGLDPANDRLLIFYADYGRIGQTWLYTWPLSAPPSQANRLFPSGIVPQSGSSWFGAFDPPTSRLMLIGGSEGFWQYEAVASPPPPPVIAGCPGDREVTAGSHLDLVFQLGPLEQGGTLDYVLSSQRAWPGLPVSGAVTLLPKEVQSLPFGIDVPDSAAAGPNRLRLAATLRGVGSSGSCDAVMTVSPPASIPAVDLTCAPGVTSIPGGQVRGRFRATLTGSAATSLDWAATSVRAWPGFPRSGNVPVGGGGLANLDLDIAVPDTARVGVNAITVTFRSASDDVADSCAWAITGPGETTMPIPEFAFRMAPNPAIDIVGLNLSLAHDTNVRVELRNLATGRLVLAREFGRLEAGVYPLELSEGGEIPSGIYAVRLFLDGFTRSSKLVVLR